MQTTLSSHERETLRQVLERSFSESQAQTLVSALELLAQHLGESQLHRDLLSFQQETKAWQQHMEQRAAQAEQRWERIEGALERLAASQARTEERVTRLEEATVRLEEGQRVLQDAVAQLAAAQARTEERVSRLEDAIAQLTHAQARTEAAVQQLTRQVGGLSDTVGGDIEDIAYIVLYDVLKREFGWEVGPLERTWQQWNGEPEEVNIFGQASDPASPEQPIWIVGEAKHNLSLREVERFAKQVERARQHLTGRVFAVCFCYRARPEVRTRLHALGIPLVFSYGRLLQ
ncbi:MAG: hypothetical protein D6704_07475 [Nitrospirae bacterium]|nr:MAG: hypothetical protein D6704_07475 [Nitrospirota bacterium]